MSDVQLIISEALANILATHAEVEQGQDGAINVKIADHSDATFKALEQLLMQCADNKMMSPSQTKKDYSVYFAAVTGSALYKPGNPTIALLQVAKSYQIDIDELTAAFKQQV